MTVDINKLSIGIDLVEISRFKGLDEKPKFIDNIFTKKELKDCQGKNNLSQSLAGRFAAKEAVRKTIKENIEFNKIEINNTKNGLPEVKFLDKKVEHKYKSLISISHTEQIAQAVCLTIHE